MDGERAIDPVRIYRAGRETVLLVDGGDRGCLALTGSKRQDLLHRVTTNAIKPLQPGEGTCTLLINAKGRLLDRMTVLCQPQRLLVITTSGRRQATRDALARYVVFEDVEVTDTGDEIALLELHGPQASRVLAAAGVEAAGLQLFHHREVRLGETAALLFSEPGFFGPAFLLMLPAAARGAASRRLQDAGAADGLVADAADGVEALRVETGLPACGSEIAEAWNPLEMRQEDAVSFDKGCYVGQEVIARLRTYDKVKRHLFRVEIEGEAPVPPAATLLAAGRAVGEITSAVAIPGENRVAALAAVDRAVENNTEIRVATAEGERAARLVGPPPTAVNVRVAPPPALAGGKQRQGS